MNKDRYLVEITQEIITPISVYAASEQEARDLAMQGNGEPGDPYYPPTQKVSVVLKDDLQRDQADK